MKSRKPWINYAVLTDNEVVYRVREKNSLNTYGKSYRLIDLFAGAGGLTLGFTKSLGQVFIPVWANDFNHQAANTYRTNFGCHCTTDDILDIGETRINEIPHADVVIGGPPCKGFILLNHKGEMTRGNSCGAPTCKSSSTPGLRYS